MPAKVATRPKQMARPRSYGQSGEREWEWGEGRESKRRECGLQQEQSREIAGEGERKSEESKQPSKDQVAAGL